MSDSMDDVPTPASSANGFDAARLEELSEALERVEQRISIACHAAGRDREDVSLIVVTKTFPPADAVALAQIGVRDVGENRHPEGEQKKQALAALPVPPRLHFLGHLQTNKAGAVARYADVIHSLDRLKLARSLSRGAQAADREIEVLIQVDFDGTQDQRSGVSPEQVLELADGVAELDGLRLRGLMTVAPLDVDPRPVFEELRSLSERLRSHHAEADVISAGMSGDLEAAVGCGATHLRVGRAILGDRSNVR